MLLIYTMRVDRADMRPPLTYPYNHVNVKVGKMYMYIVYV